MSTNNALYIILNRCRVCLARSGAAKKDGVGARAEVLYRCACKEKEMACGSDNRTYSNVCQLNEAIAKLGNNGTLISIQYWGPCESGK